MPDLGLKLHFWWLERVALWDFDVDHIHAAVVGRVVGTANHPAQVIQRLERLDLHARLVVALALGQLLAYPAHVTHLSRRETGAARYATTRLRNDDLLEGQRALGLRRKAKDVRVRLGHVAKTSLSSLCVTLYVTQLSGG